MNRPKILKRFSIYSFYFILSHIIVCQAQISPLPGLNGIQNQIGSLGGGGLGGGGIGGSGIGSMNGGLEILNRQEIKGADPVIASNSKVPIPFFGQLELNWYQKYLFEVSGKTYPIYGSSFFENIHQLELPPSKQEIQSSNDLLSGNLSSYSPFAPFTNPPVSYDYTLGPGDQLLIRTWGSIDINYQAVIDRNGLISIPRVGSLSLTGVSFGEAKGVINQLISKQYKNYELNVSIGKTRSITIYVVGQARRPGSYTLSSLSTLSTALFASGGPNNMGSYRHLQLKRSGKLVSEFDLYEFLALGQSKGDIKLIDGDILVIPPALGYVALTGKINSPAVFEIKSEHETLEDIIKISGGLPLTTSTFNATLERLEPTNKLPRVVINLLLNKDGLKTLLNNGDVVTFYSISPELSNAVTLRGNVSQPRRIPFKEGMRITDLIPNKELLISSNSIRLQNEVLFDMNERERTQRFREQIPNDLLMDPTQQIVAPRQSTDTPKAFDLSSKQIIDQKVNQSLNTSSISFDNGQSSVISLDKWKQQREDRLLAQQPSITNFKKKSIVDQIGDLMDQVNFDYAVVERVNRNDLSVNLLSFNLGQALDHPSSPDNLVLESGDVITIFSQNDFRVPLYKRRINVTIEGEVSRPGIYQVSPGDTLSNLIRKAGGLTKEAYLFGSSLFREDVRKTQLDNLDKLLRRLESETTSSLTQLSQSLGASTDTTGLQARVTAAQQTQRSAIERLKNLKPEGRIALGLTPSIANNFAELPEIKLQDLDRLVIPPVPDFVYVYGSINTESALLYKKGLMTSDYLNVAGVTSGGDRDAVILLRADGTAISSNGSWNNKLLSTEVLPGDTIVIPEKLDRESVWSSVFRNTLGGTQIFYQLGLGAAAIKTLRQ